MTKKELIKLLEPYPDDTTIVRADREENFLDIGEISLKEIAVKSDSYFGEISNYYDKVNTWSLKRNYKKTTAIIIN